ncbi:GNAT family N-acetyltransferase [Catenuloplanes japonicus]|uniref:GNAT family N-acetyltransferase n=1 Tax=Catenuloplanes japonicus TaxID=33876 RepID=UPI00068F0EFB|nr:GNAT family N-acetyltransferase [Catenuloplanes japonicus]
MPYSLRLAGAADLPWLPPLEIAAGACFADVGMDAIAADAPPSLDELAGYQRDGRAWVVAAAPGMPVAYLLADLVDDEAHVSQVSVHPAHAGHGLGAALINTCELWGYARGAHGTTLTTFADVPWNAPYYARLGFVVVPDDALPAGLAEIRERERACGLDRWPRVAMRRGAAADRGLRGRKFGVH